MVWRKRMKNIDNKCPAIEIRWFREVCLYTRKRCEIDYNSCKIFQKYVLPRDGLDHSKREYKK